MSKQSNTFQDDYEAQQYVLKLHNFRCVGVDRACYKYTTTVHEILPRSRGKISYDVHNRVPLCAECHERVHMLGVSESMITKLRERRRLVLEGLGKYDAI